MNAMQKAITQLQKKCTPIKDENDFEYYATNNIVWAMEIAIQEAKKEVFNLVITKIRERMDKQIKFRANCQVNSLEWDETFFRTDEIKKLRDDLERHLSTLPKAKELNSDYEASADMKEAGRKIKGLMIDFSKNT